MKYEERMKWWNEARFGMFIHWGLFSILGRDCWVMHDERIPEEEYAQLAKEFNPPKEFNVESWVKLARDAGMKYMVLTTRHHDGFCLFDSEVSDFTSVKTAAKRDFFAEYVEACRKFGMRVGLYYSLLDWRFPGYFRGPEKDPEGFNKMVEQVHAQVRELMSNYGKIDYLFYDGEWIPGVEFNRGLIKQGESLQVAKYWRSKELNRMVRELQPHIIINNRSGLEEDVDTPERYVVSSKEERAWESNMTIGDGWGYFKYDSNFKSVHLLLQHLVACAGCGGNFLLNVGPKPDGSIQKEFVTRLQEIGRWMRVNGESIYGSERTPAGFGVGALGAWWTPSRSVTTKGNTVYLHILRWPGENATFTGIKNAILTARILATGEKVAFKKMNDGKLFLKKLPQNPADPYDTVIALELEGEPEAFDYTGIPL